MHQVIIPSIKNCYITVKGNTDGMGAQVHAIFSAMLYAKVVDKKYLHTKFRYISHNYKKDASFGKKIDEFFQLSKDEILVEQHNLINFIIVDISSTKEIFRYLALFHFFNIKKYVLFTNTNFHYFTDQFPQKYTLIQDLLREKFYTISKEYPLHKKDRMLSIAVHIRRGDVQITSNRYTDNGEITERLTNLITIFHQLNMPFQINVYSEGEKEDFKELLEIANLRLDADVFETFYNLVQADILIMAKSSFSYCAALLSRGIIIYEPFWHPPLNDWFILKEGLFKNETFISTIETVFLAINNEERKSGT